METNSNSTSNFVRGRKLVLGGFASVLAILACTLVLSATAFAGTAGESAFDKLFNALGGGALQAPSNEAPVEYKYNSTVYQDVQFNKANGDEGQSNASHNIVVSFTNNYDCEAARDDSLADPQTFTYDEGEGFTFTVGIDAAAGAPAGVVQSDGLNLQYSIGADNKVTFTSTTGITADGTIDVKYGDPQTAYTLIYFYQGSDGGWRDDHETVTKIGNLYQAIPTQDEVEAGLDTGFVVDTYDTGVALPGGIGSVSLYYARTVNSVIFNDNGGTNGPGAFFERSEVEINKEDAIPTKAGYSFDGWFTAPEGGDEVGYDTYTVVPFEKETVYYAHWTMERPDKKYVTVVYWGQKAEVSSSFDTNDYEYISEAYFERPYNSDFVFTTDAEVRPKTGGIITEQKEVQYFDADYNGEAERPIADCFTMTIASAKVDASKKVQDDDYTLYNVYLPRVTYTWEFVNSTSSSATTVADTITARWGQNIFDKYKTISNTCFSRDIGAWRSSNTSGATNILTHMNFTNHLVSEGTQWYKESSLGDIESTYYIQKIGAGTEHSNAEEIAANYDEYAVNLVQSGWSINEDEFIKIEGFITPNSEDDVDAPHSGTYIWQWANLDFFYKRSESSMSLYMIDTGAATPSPNNVVNITGIDYETTYGDIPVPEGTPGTFAEGMPHTLRYFTPLNPNIDNVDKNYVFGGWALNNNPDSTAINLDDYVMPQKAAWLYAKWVAPSDINVSFQQVTVPKTETPDGDPIVFENQTYQKKIDTSSQAIPTPTERENFYFLYWYYYDEGAQHKEANRHYFDPYNMTVPAHDLFLYPEYSSTEPNTEYLVSPVNKPHGTIAQTEAGISTPVHFFYVKAGTKFTVSEDTRTITINAMSTDLSDEIVETLTATPDTGYRFEGWQITYEGEAQYHDVTSDEGVSGPCGVKPVFVPDVESINIYITPRVIIKPYTGETYPDIEGNECFNASSDYPEVFNKDNIYTLGVGTEKDPIRINGTDHGFRYSDFFSQYTWHYLDTSVNVNFVMDGDDFSTLYVGDLGLTEPTKVPDFVYDTQDHNAFATAGSVNPDEGKAEDWAIQYYATTSSEVPSSVAEWQDTIDNVKIKEVGIYNLWYRLLYKDKQLSEPATFDPVTIGAVRIFEDEPIVPPTKAADFYYDQNQHPLFATAGSAPMGGVMQYGYSSDESTEPTTWYDSIDDAKVDTYGAFYLWYRIDEGEAVLLKVGDETQVVLGYAAYAAYFEEATTKYAAKSIVIDFYDPLKGNADEDNVIAYLPKGAVYTYDAVPWRAYFLSPYQAQHFYISNPQLENWLNGEDISNWFYEGYYILNIFSYEGMFYNNEGQCRVTASSGQVFYYCDQLVGGNGTGFQAKQSIGDLTYLHEDYANEDGSLHEGYITSSQTTLNILYDYNGGSGVPAVPETRQIVDVNKYYTVTGVNKIFAGEPKWPGHKFLGWKYDDDNIYATGDTVSAFYPSGTTHFSQITLVALWEDVIDPVHTPPVAADDFWFDNVRHHLFSQAGSAEGEGNVFYYTYTTVQNPENDPVPGIYETWESNINSLQSWPSASPQVYYLWYKINEDGAYHKVLDGEGNHAYVASNTLNFCQKFDEQGEFFVRFSLYMPREGYIPQDIGGDTIKIDMEYTARNNIPWSINSEAVNYMIVDDDVRVWFQHNTNKAYLTNWFSGFPNLEHIYASESTFYNTETSESYVQGQNVFTNSNSLFGGNGTAYATRTADDLTYLHVDRANATQNILGYLTEKDVNVQYNLNGGSLKDEEKTGLLTEQNVPADAHFTVGGVDNYFANPDNINPPEEGKTLLGWRLGGSTTTYQNGDKVSAASGASTGVLTLTAVWSGEVTEVDKPTWKQNILYDGQQHDVSSPDFWNNYYTNAMIIGNTVVAVEPGTYTATFTLNDGFVWKGEAADVRTTNVVWSIVEITALPTIADNFTYDNQEHALIATPGVCSGLELQYSFTKDQFETAPIDNWTNDYTQVTGNEVGRYYIWYRGGDNGNPILLQDEYGNRHYVISSGAYALYEEQTESGLQNTLTLGFVYPYEWSDVPSGEALLGYVPYNVEYSSVDKVLWADKMGDIKNVVFDDSIQYFTSYTEGKSAYMSHWFDGASNLETIFGEDSAFYNNNEWLVVGQSVFVGCTKLLGGNGTAYSEAHQGVDYLLEDYIIPDGASFVKHSGYLTTPKNTVHIMYDYNGGQGHDIINKQYIELSRYTNFACTIGGEGSAFADAPTKEGYSFEGWLYQRTFDTYQHGDYVNVSFGSSYQEEVTLVAKWKPYDPRVAVTPAPASLTYYDRDDHQVIGTAGQLVDGSEDTLLYNVTHNTSETAPTEGWNADYTSFKAIEPGAYYIWYKVNDDGAPILLTKAQGVEYIPWYMEVRAACAYTVEEPTETGENTLILNIVTYTVDNFGGETPEDIFGDNFQGYIPQGVEYAKASDVPWSAVMEKIDMVFIDASLMTWVHADGVSNPKTRFISRWFDGAKNMKMAVAMENCFYDWQSGQCLVSGSHIFDGCDELLGGNGSSIETLQSTGLDCLHEDYYTIAEQSKYQPHYGLLTSINAFMGYGLNVVYDYNYEGEELPLLNRQLVTSDVAFTVGGVGNNCGPIPTRAGYRFVGWQIGDAVETVYQPGTNLPAIDYITEDQYSTLTFKAQWEEASEKPEQEVTVDVHPSEGFYVNQFGKLEVLGIQENPTMSWELITTDTNFPGRFDFASDDKTFIAYIQAITAGQTKAVLHINETANYAATDVPVTFEILGQTSEAIQLEESYDVNVADSIDVEAAGISAGRMVQWEVVSGGDKAQIKYVNNNPVAVVGVAEGTATIKITAKESVTFTETSATTTINVENVAPKPEQELVLSKENIYLDINYTDNVNVSGEKENPSILWTIADTSIAQITTDPVDHTITVKGLKYGTTTLTVTTSETTNYAETSKTIDVIVEKTDNVYLKNRSGIESTIKAFSGAKSAEFSRVIPDEYLDSLVIDDRDAGTIKAYKVGTQDDYKVVIASTQNICSNETSMASFFKSFTNLESVEFNNLDTSKSTSFIGTFSGCRKLESVYLPFDTSNVDDFGWMFDNGCENLVKVEIGPNFVVRDNAKLRFMFDHCTALTSIIVPEGTDWSNVTGDCSGVFTSCINLPHFNPKEIGKTRAFEGQKSGVYGYFTAGKADKAYLANRGSDKDSIIKKYREAKSVEFSHVEPQSYEEYIVIDRDNEDKIRAYKVADGDGYKVVIYSSFQIYASNTSFTTFLKKFTNLESVDFGDVNTSEATSLCGMFSSCKNLTSVTLNFDTSYVTDFSYMFDNGCEKLTEINLGNDFVVLDGANVSQMFIDCKSLSTIRVKHGTDWSQTAGSSSGMFTNCTKLPHFTSQFVGKERAYCGTKGGAEGYFTDADANYVYMKNRGNDKDSIIKGFRGAENVSFSNQIPASYSEAINVDDGNIGEIKAYKIDKTDGAYDVVIASEKPIAANETTFATLFKGFTNLLTIDFGNINTDSITSLVGTFSGCKNLKKINMETFNTENVDSFAWMCDAGCTALVEVKFGDNFIVQENAVLTSMFDGCSALASIIVPKGTDLTYVMGDSTSMFKGCINLPYFSADQDDYRRAYEGVKDGVTGYFVDGSSQVVYLANRGEDKDSIIKNYRDAKSVVFTHTEPISFDEYIAIDTERDGWIKAYKVADGDGYKVEIYSAYTMVSRSTSLTTMFKNFNNLTSVDFGDLDTSNATSLVGLFSGCKNLAEVTLNFDTRNVTDFGWMFDNGCTSLVTVNLGDDFVVGENSNLVSMFDGCSKLENIMVKDGTDWSTTKGNSSNMFANCVLLPEFSSSATNNVRAYTGEKSSVKGYFKARGASRLFNLFNWFNNKENGEQANATYSLNVSATNNYDCEDARQVKEVVDPVPTYEENTPFTLEVSFDPTYGTPTNFILSEDLNATCTVGVNNTITIHSDNGLTKDSSIDICYGSLQTAYKVLYFHQLPDGGWRDYDEADTVTYISNVYAAIPTTEQVEDPEQLYEGFAVDTYDVGTALPGGIGAVSVYYARKVNTVVFDDNGGVNGPGTFYERSDREINKADIQPTRAGYTFEGWYTDPVDGEEVDYDTYTVVPRASETKYYAHWTMDNVDSKVITVIYWGENADLATEGQFSTGDYSYITEATYTAAYNSKFSISADADLRPDNDKCMPKVSQIDTDGDGTLDHDVDDCYSLTFNPSDTSLAPKVDDPINVKDDDTTVYNVYLKRTKFTWEFRTFAKLEVKSTGRRGFTETWSFGELYDNGTIKARWGQNITDKYSIVENEAFGADDKVRNWVVDGEGVQRGDWDVSSNITYMGYFTNMDLNNRVQSSDNSTKPFGKNDLEYDDVDGIKYYLQKVNAGSEHSTPQEIAQNYNLAYTQYLPADTEFTYSEEDWINIDGFDAPDKNSGVDSPVLGTTVEDGDEFFYKRSERDLYLYVVQPRAGEATGYYTKANTVDYQAPIADVDVSDLPGTWKDASAPHTLANFIPNKPSLSALDTNFVFRGWSLSPDSELINLEDLTMPLGTFTLYARWGAPNITVTFYQERTAKDESTIYSPSVIENQTYKQKITQEKVPEPEYHEMFYFLYWYYYDEGAQHTEANRHYFDPYNMTVPAHDLVLYPEYSSLEPGTEFLVSPVHKAHGTLSQTTGGQSVDVHYFYVKANEQFTVDAANRTLTITDMDGKVQQLTATPDTDYKFSGWQYTYGSVEDYQDISTGAKVEHACGVKAVFEPINPIVSVPTWKEDITYTGEEHVVTSVGYWNNFNTNAMTIGGTVRATEVGTYTATFTLKEGYVWTNGSTDPANVEWHIINGGKEDQVVTTEVMPEDGFYVNQYGKLEVKGIQDNPTMYWEIVTTDVDFPGRFEFNIQSTTYVAYIHALQAGMAKAILHVNATQHFNAIDVPVEFEILGQTTETIQLDASYDVVAGESIDVTAEGLTSDRMVQWEVVDGADYVQLKYVNNNPVAVVGLAEGSATIKITAEASIPFAESTATTTINVAGSGPKPQQDLVLSRDKVQLDLTLTDHVNVSGDKENPSILWTIEDTSIAQITTDPINHTITVKGLKYGTTTLTVTTSETENYAETSKSIEVVVAQAENVYLKNRLGYESIIGVYRGAKSAEFTHVIPDQYLESIVIDDQNAGTIKAYKVGTHDNYKVIIASTQNICTNETSFASFFKGFADLESVEFNNINTSKATSLIAMFSGCRNLKSVNLPFNTSNVVDYGWMFDANCEKLVSVEIGPDFVVRENATLHYMFENCTSLTSIVVPAGTDWSNATGESTGMFTNCVNLPYFVPQHTDKTRAYAGQKGGENGYFVTQITDKTYLKNRGTDKDSIIKQYREAKSVEFSHTQPQAYEDYIVIDRDNEDKIRAYKVADGLGYKVVIYCSNQIYCYETSFVTFFKNFVNLESVDFGDINTSEAKSLCGMFSGCRKLPSVTLNFDTSAVTDFTYMFDNWCEKLVEIDLGNDFVVGNGANVSLMFVDCTSLTTIKVKHGTDWSQTAGSSTDMFSNCTNLPHFDPQFVGKDRAYCGSKDGVEGYFTDADADYVYMKNRGDDKDSIIKRYRGADNVSFSNQIPSAYSEAINIDEGDLGVIKAYKIDKGSGTYDVIIASNRPIAAGETSLASLFKGFNNLVSVDFGELNTDSITSLVGTFSGCKKLPKINMETFNTEHVTSFGWMCDAGCSALVEVKLGNKFVVQENAVLTCMFDSCSSLTSIIVPKGTDWSNVKGDSTGMFNGCLNLPYHVDGQDNCQRAYEGIKDGVYGYFVDGTSQVVYLTNRGADKDSIIKNYRDAKSVVFTHTEPTSYEEFTAIDTEREGWVKAYKVADGDGYKVEIYSAYTMVSRATSLTTMFKNFVNLTSVDFGDLDTSNATSLVGMFSGCKSLTELTLNFNTRNVTDFGWMCDAGCTSLVTVNLGDNFVVGENSSLVSMFDGCSKLQNIMVKDGTDWSTTKGDSSNMFANCVLLPGFSSSAVNISRAYTGEKSGVKGYLTARNANKLCPESNNNIKQDNGPSLNNDPVLDNNSNGEITIEGQNPEEANLPSKEENI